jgi:hypothetical protein
MKRNIFFGLLFLGLIGCATNAQVEVGLVDETLLARAPLGALNLRVTKIELPVESDYETIWEGSRWVTVSIQNGVFASITDSRVDVTPDSYRRMRISADSLNYVSEGGDTTSLANDPIQFAAEAFTDIIIADGDELTFAVNIRSDIWLSLNPVGIISGHTPFEGAVLKLKN